MFRAQQGKKIAEEASEPPKSPVDGKRAAVAEEVLEKPKRKYVKSGRFVGKFNDYQKQREARASQEGKATGKRQRKPTSGRSLTIMHVTRHCCGCMRHLLTIRLQ